MSSEVNFLGPNTINQKNYTHEKNKNESRNSLKNISLSTFATGNSETQKKDQRPLFTSGSISTNDISSDISYTLRQLSNLWVDSPVFSAEGITTGFNCVQGAVATHRAYLRTKSSREVDDHWGVTEGSLDMLRGATQSLGGTAYACLRPISIAASIKKTDVSGPHVSTSLGKSVFFLGTIGNVFFGLFYIFLGAWTGFNFYKTQQFKNQLNATENHEERMKFLSRKLKVDPTKIFNKIHGKDPGRVNQHLQRETVEMISNWLKAHISDDKLLKEAGMSFFGSFEKRKIFVEKILTHLQKENPVNSEQFLKDLGLDPVKDKAVFEFAADNKWGLNELLGLKHLLGKIKTKKEMKVARAASGTCLESIKKAEDSKLLERLASFDQDIENAAKKEATHLMDNLKKDINNNLIVNGLICASAVVGVVATILAFVFTGGIGAFVVGVLFLAVCVCMLAGDGVSMHLGLQHGVPGKYDKRLLVANTILCFVALVVVIGLIAAGGIGLVPALMALAIGVAWLTNNGYALVKINAKEKAYFAENPTLQVLSKAIQRAEKTKEYDQVIALFKKLPKEERDSIKGFLENSGERVKKNRSFKIRENAKYDATHDFGEEYFKATNNDQDMIKAVEKCMLKHSCIEFSTLHALLTNKNNLGKAYDYFSKMASDKKEEVKKAIYMTCTQSEYFSSFNDQKLKALKEAVIKAQQLEKEIEKELKKQTEQYEEAFWSLLRSY